MKYIYLLKGINNFYKIGITENINNRLSNLNTSSPENISVVTSRLVDDARTLEVLLHTKYAHLKSKEVGEWFKLTSEQAIGICIEIHSATGYVERPYVKELRDTVSALIESHEEVRKNVDQLMSIFSSLKITRPRIVINTGEGEEIIPEPQAKLRSNIKMDDRVIYEQAKEVIKKHDTASASFLQRKLKIGYSRAARILDMLEVAGHVGEQKGSYARQVLKK